ncbi:MAG: RNA-binding cell elongation regulator Jag/EloR [Clostridia bacterium]
MSLSQFLKKNSSTEQRAKNVNDAIAAALKELNAAEDDVTIEIIDEGSKGFLGIGAREAVVRVTLKNAAAKQPESEKTPDAVPAAKPAKKTVALRVAKPAKITAAVAPEDAAVKFLNDIFGAMHLDVTVDAKSEEKEVSIELSGDNMGIVIGKRGDTLDSLQYLTSLVVNQDSDEYIKVSIDTENYREKRTEALLALSKRLADKVTRTGKKFTLEPMNPYERRVIHSNLQDSETVTTYSIGSEPYRKVVIAPKNAKPYYKKNSGYKKRSDKQHNTSVAEKSGSYTTTYKADYKPQQHKAEYKNFEDYLAAQQAKSEK